MLDVILYGYDRRGRLDLRERRFESLLQLALFFTSDDAEGWQWAEIHQQDPDGRILILRHLESPRPLRGI